ncbi:RHS repeat-associated core domain-containing protein, partial [Paraburkholderia sp.]|uniref:RHS repeat-associated core domain-containing protein n=1 Tax=Paraburkholderia sp. TaxID=1926495 RepID=UPI003A520FEA
PSTARFISEDPIGYASGQTNAYAYVGGNPVQFRDPRGLQAIPVPAPPPLAGPSCSPGSREFRSGFRT